MVHFGAICKHWGLHSSKQLEIQVLDWHFLKCSGLRLIGWIVVIYRIVFLYAFIEILGDVVGQDSALSVAYQKIESTRRVQIQMAVTPPRRYLSSFTFVAEFFQQPKKRNNTVCNKIQCYNVLQLSKNKERLDSQPLISCEDQSSFYSQILLLGYVQVV